MRFDAGRKIAKEVQPLNEVLKQMQKRIVEGIQLPDKKQQNQLRKDVEQAVYRKLVQRLSAELER